MTRPVVLLVEDDARHVELFELGFEEVGLDAELRSAPDAAAAREVVERALDDDADLSRWVVLLDLNLPGISGLELLCSFRADERFDALTIVMLTTSGLPSDLMACAASGADGYVVKPMSYHRLLDEIVALGEMWIPSAPIGGAS